MSHFSDKSSSIHEMHSPASRCNELRRFLGYMNSILLARLSDAATSIHCCHRFGQKFHLLTMAGLHARDNGIPVSPKSWNLARSPLITPPVIGPELSPKRIPKSEVSRMRREIKFEE